MNTYRRELLDRFLVEHQHLMTGKVLDIGGKKEKKRGGFQPPLHQVESWSYANIDEGTNPDYLCRAESLPFDDDSIDVFLLCEVLEHLENPEIALTEAFRILCPDGYGLLTIPFLYPAHADPYDFQRWTDTKLKMVLEGAGFEVVKLSPMGGFFVVIADLIQIQLNEIYKRWKVIGKFGFITLKLVKILFGQKALLPHERITSGFSIIVQKKSTFKEPGLG